MFLNRKSVDPEAPQLAENFVDNYGKIDRALRMIRALGYVSGLPQGEVQRQYERANMAGLKDVDILMGAIAICLPIAEAASTDGREDGVVAVVDVVVLLTELMQNADENGMIIELVTNEESEAVDAICEST